MTIGGSDPSGGAGIQADLKTFAAFGVYGMSVLTAVTAQNTCGIQDSFALSPDKVSTQLNSIFDDITVESVKTGMLVDEDTVCIVSESLKKYSAKKLVVDPVITAKDGTYLLSLEAIGALKRFLLPLARLVTPNTYEAAILSGIDKVDTQQAMREAALRIADGGASAVLVKGGHLEGSETVDILLDNGDFYSFEDRRIGTGQPHGTGCTLSAAISACLAQDKPFVEAVDTARKYTRSAISAALGLGRGFTLLDHNAAGNWKDTKYIKK